jgi:cysteinyl-tRNA synthetase
MNITDVGHLTGDRDMGADKMEKEAKKEGKTAWEIADFYTKTFKDNLAELNIITPNVYCKATDHIAEQIAMIEELERRGYTYKILDGIYFDTSKITDYTKLSHQNIDALKEGARVEKNDEKLNPTDFALWKFSPHVAKLADKRQMEWSSPWGVGFPGWHIECSAMSMRYLGDHIDIHCGAVDHINIHHTNELAQSEAATGKKPWVNFWLHGEFLNLNGGRKMSKSSGDIITLDNTFIKKNLDPLIYRFATLNLHYRKPMEWNENIIESSKNGFDNFLRRVKALGNKIGKVDNDSRNLFLEAINDDLNLPKALAITNEVFRSNLSDEDKLATVLDFDKVLGLKLENFLKKEPTTNNERLPDKVGKMIAERQIARENKNWKESDRLRQELKKEGYEIKDTPTGPQIIKI